MDMLTHAQTRTPSIPRVGRTVRDTVHGVYRHTHRTNKPHTVPCDRFVNPPCITSCNPSVAASLKLRDVARYHVCICLRCMVCR